MKNYLRVLCLALAVIIFSVFAIGSGSEKASENKGEDSPAAGENNGSAEKGEAEYKIGDAVASVRTDSIGSTYVTVSWSVKNTGTTNLYLKSSTADVENSKGELEDTISMINGYPDVIKPGETGYYYESSLYDGKAKSDLKLIPHADIEKASVDCIRYKISEVKVTDEQYLGAKILGRVENTTDETGSLVEVAAILFDSNGKLIGTEFTYLDNDLAAGDKVAFECSSLNTELKASDIAKYEVYAYPTQYNW